MRPLPAVHVRTSLKAHLIAEARRARPAECCGLLVGTRHVIEFAAATPNLAGPGRYLIEPVAHIELRRTLRRLKPAISIVGAYHSHPNGPATPSNSDVTEAMYPEWTYLIVTLGRRATVRAFRLTRGRARERPIRWY